MAICALMASADAVAQERQRCTSLEPGPQRTVARIIDGETVALDDGRELRLIGALAPRALDAGAESGAWPLEAAASEALGVFVLGPELLAAEGNAREARTGVWAQAAYAVRAADDPAELLRYHARFQVVEGRVARVAQVRGFIYLNFGSFRRRAFFASLRDADRAVLGEHARDPKGLEGRVVRVRGWIERRGNAPNINLSSAGLIEIIDTGSGVGGRAR